MSTVAVILCPSVKNNSWRLLVTKDVYLSSYLYMSMYRMCFRFAIAKMNHEGLVSVPLPGKQGRESLEVELDTGKGIGPRYMAHMALSHSHIIYRWIADTHSLKLMLT
jgi:hypothetical protein